MKKRLISWTKKIKTFGWPWVRSLLIGNICGLLYIKIFLFLIVWQAEMTELKKARDEVGILGDNEIFIGETITPGMALNVIRYIKELERDPEVDEICICINSDGGQSLAALAICRAMKKCRKPIKTEGIMNVLSAAVPILSNGTKGRRFILEGTDVAIHEGVFPGNNQWSKFGLWFVKHTFAWAPLQYLDRSYCQLLSETTGKSAGEIRKNMKNETWFSAEEAVEYGLADSTFVFF